MAKTRKLNSRIYTPEKVRYSRNADGWDIEKLPDGCLYAGGIYPTKITAEDLPEWYVWGRFYKRWCWLNTKGITDMVYRPCYYSNHFLKDDCLMLSYGGKITITDTFDTERENPAPYRDYEGVDEHIWGNDIITVLKGARDYSGYDITLIIELLKAKAEWLRKEYPNELGDFTFEPSQYGL